MRELKFETISKESLRERVAKFIRFNHLSSEEFYGLVQEIRDDNIEDYENTAEHDHNEVKEELKKQLVQNNEMENKLQQIASIVGGGRTRKIKVGQYLIEEVGLYGKPFITNKNGEGMELDMKKFEEHLDVYFNREF